MNLSIFIGRRLSFNPGSGRPTPPGVAVGVAGIALALIVMMVSIAVVTGFKHEIREKVTGFESEITIYAHDMQTGEYESSGFQLTPSLRSVIAQSAGEDARVTYSVRQPGILKTDSAFTGVVIKGVSPDFDWTFVREALVSGEIPDYANSDDELTNTIIISSDMARKLGAVEGDRIYAHFFRNNTIASRRLTVKAVYDTRFSDYDGLYAFTPALLLQQLAGVDSTTVGAVEINGIQGRDVEEVTDRLRAATMQLSINDTPGRIYEVSNVRQAGAMYFNWLELLDTNVAVILILMTLVSGFTLISSLFILILDRINTIGLLKAMGADNSLVRAIFIVMAERLVVRGLVIGNIIGLGLLFVQHKWHLIPLDPEAYYLAFVPVEINWWYIVALNVGVAVVSCLMLILPSQMISTLSPARSIRYE
ncbi:MAG: ABC transporter permease [Paramuribaculum sp.]|nr:ABC transporter permease [Bacteroidales bacterium]MDE7449293.1 ABC transporter permease [Paramuribaculum sp.]